MRQGQNTKRSRGRGGGGGRRNASPRHQNFDSNGPSIRIRGNASQVYEKYLQLARDANASGDRITAENMYQHAEHYFRILNVDDGDGNQSRNNNRGNGSDSRQADRQQNGDQPETGDSENQETEQKREAEPERRRRDNSPQPESETGEDTKPPRRPARRPRRAPARAAEPGNGSDPVATENRTEPDTAIKTEAIVEKPVVEAVSTDGDTAEERLAD